MPHFLSGSDKFPFIAQGSRWEFCFISVEDGYVVIQRNRLFYIIENYVLTNESAEPSSRISMVGVCQCDKKILWTFSTKLEHSCTVLRLYHKNEQEICYDQDY